MVKTFLSAALAVSTLTGVVATPAVAQSGQQEYRRDVRDAQRDLQRDLRQADDRGDVRQARQEYRRDVRQAQRDYRRFNRYDYNRLEPGQRRYYADRYYRDGRYYQTRVLGRNDRIYRGNDNRYYCRRNDGTTGLIIGGLAGGVVGNLIAPGRSSLITTLLGAGGGALIGRSIDRRQVVCR